MSFFAVLYSRASISTPPLPGGEDALWAPPVDVYQSGDEIVVEMELPGTAPEHVRVVYRDAALLVEGVKGPTVPPERLAAVARFLRVEREAGPFRRVVALPCAGDPARGRARFRDGLLTVWLPRCGPER